MKPNVPKSGFFSRIIIAAALSLMAACSPESAEPETTPEAAPGTSDPVAPVEESNESEADNAQQQTTDGARPENYSAAEADLAPDGELASLELTDGEWFMNGGEAMFGPPESEAIFTIGCDPQAGEIIMTRSIDLTGNRQARLGVFTDEGAAGGYWRDAGDVMPIAIARLPMDASIFGDIVSSERFAVAAEGSALLVMPVNEGVRAVIDECAA
ncbi:hypothetical protein KUV46_08905 [Thalassovita mediterranea]|nr:hypothetical protein KUV46_08905 [Thalassovita mediterranea]